MTATLDECRLRDAKRLYAQFAGGQLRGLPGEDSSYEAPDFAEVTADGGNDDAAFAENRSILGSPRAPTPSLSAWLERPGALLAPGRARCHSNESW